MGFLNSLFGNKSGKEEGMKMESSGKKEHGATAAATKVKDPVCGMDIDPKTAAGKSEYNGKTYYFCSPGCKRTFDASPAKYAGGAPQQPAGGHGHMM